MDIEQYIKDMKDKFQGIEKIEVINKKRLMINIPRRLLMKIIGYWFDDLEYRYIIISAMDSKAGYEIIYHFADDSSGWIMNLNVLLPHDEPEIESITPIVYGAEWIEREIMDILGIKFIGHPKPKRLFFSEDWPEGEYPYRRKIRQENR